MNNTVAIRLLPSGQVSVFSHRTKSTSIVTNKRGVAKVTSGIAVSFDALRQADILFGNLAGFKNSR